MAKLELNDSSRTFRFDVNSKELDLMVVTLPIIKLNNVDWTVKMCKKSIGDEDDDNSKSVLSITLTSDFGGDVSNGAEADNNWICKASASFKLFHKTHAIDGSVVKNLPEKTFDDENSSHRIDEFIKWNDFLKNHVQGNTAKLEIEIITRPLKRKEIESQDIKPVSAKFHIKIENVSKLKRMYSPEIVLQGVRWKVCCLNENENLGVYVCAEKSDMDEYWFYRFDLTFKLLSYNIDGHEITKNLKNHLHQQKITWGLPEFLKWSEFIDPTKGYVVSDTALLTVNLTVEDPVPMW